MAERGDVLIENPIINSPFFEPNKQFAFDDFGIKNEVVDGRRPRPSEEVLRQFSCH